MTRSATWLLLYLTAVLSAQTISFLPPLGNALSGFAIGSTSCSTYIANGDGRIDIVYSGSEQIGFGGVLLGNGDGTFRTSYSFTGPNSPAYFAPPAVADFNGDGTPDIVFLGDFTYLYPGNSDGTFGTRIPIPGCSEQLPHPTGAPAITVADLNHDGKADLICGPTILLGKGDGTFVQAPISLDGNVVMVADFNGDGIPDVLFTTYSSTGQLAIALGSGDGTFGSDILLSLTNNFETPLAGDFNGDGHTDLVGMAGFNVAVFLGRGDGTFGPAIVNDSGPTAIGQVTAIGDLNLDGKLDVVAGDAVLAGNGDGTFRFPAFVGIATEPCNLDYLNVNVGGLGCDYGHVATAVADFNGDGLPDLASVYLIYDAPDNASAVSLSVLLNDSPGDGFTATAVSSATATWPVAPNSLVSAFGVNLASMTEAAASSPLPTTLGGIRLHVRSRSQPGDTLAPLL